ncbi:probable alkaline/neutral invertase F isoform X2 [Magnolia sinica]|nr:probable alkaline/neutral invertase F isoform X2 [Magnolia sinica]XP_058107514.1 probable alkaline/neutral invertase F isoform X2 [Magnolia sinica]XP_058107515.1 probable alkaline/neutral invertase F isoform X2 [Magnolia sinica]
MSNQMSAPLGNQESNKVETSDGHLHQAELVRYQSLALAKFSEVAENMRSPRSGSNTPRLGHTYFDPHPMVTEAWECLRKSVVKFKGHMVGTIAALDQASDALNYNQVFVRDFVPSALAFLMNDETEIVKNFLLKTLHFQASEKRIDCFTLAQGVMPASFKVLYNPTRGCDVLVADFGETAIGRVAPVDSGFWWIFLLRAYTKATGDYSLSQMPECQTGIKMILSLCLAEGFDTFPTLLCADGCCMIDRRMGIYGYPIEIQALFVMALRCAHQLLRVEGDGKEFIKLIDNRLSALIYHMRSYYWLDFKQLNNIYRFKTEEYSNTAVNKFNVIPESIPHWIFDFMPMKGGYLIGNVSPARMDFRWFALGNCMAILCSLTTDEQSVAIMDLIEERWQDLVGEMPMKAMYPALDTHEWRIVTGCDPKNTHWSYHNGGSWPVLLWLLTAACVKTGRPQIARRALELAECRLAKDGWPEYYDGKDGNYIGKQSRKMQTWSIAGYLVAKMLLEDPSHLGMMALEEDKNMKPMLTRATTMPTKLHPYY